MALQLSEMKVNRFWIFFFLRRSADLPIFAGKALDCLVKTLMTKGENTPFVPFINASDIL